MKIPTSPDFRSPTFLRQHIAWIMDFYYDRAIDPSGGMYHFFLDDGTVYDARTRHLVSATRFVITHAMLYQLTGEARFQAGVRHAVDFLRQAFLDPKAGGYAWTIDWHERQGSTAGVTDPAHVRVEFFLINVASGYVMSRSVFEEKQEGLANNLMNVGTFFKRRGKWVTAEELTIDGMHKAVKDMGL